MSGELQQKNAEEKIMSISPEMELGRRLCGKYMTFKLDKEEYGLQILKVKELIGLMQITKVPKSESFIKGVINLRGKVIPVMDLRLKFEMEETRATDQTVIIVVQIMAQGREITMGVIVDEVMEVLDISADKIEPTPRFGAGAVDADFIMGVGKSASNVIFLLDINKILTREEVDQVAATYESANT